MAVYSYVYVVVSVVVYKKQENLDYPNHMGDIKLICINERFK